MNIVALIPARGGSKRIPNKNLIPLAGQPLLYYSIKFAQTLPLEKVVVSSDDVRILAFAKKLKVDTILRPPDLAEDMTKTGEVLKHAIEHLESNGHTTDALITLQPTNPFRSVSNLSNAIAHFKENDCMSLLSVALMHKKFGTCTNKSYTPQNYQFGERSQDMKRLYYETGQFYITSRQVALRGQVNEKNPTPWICDNWYDQVDIDTLEDLKIAEALAYLFKAESDFLHV